MAAPVYDQRREVLFTKAEVAVLKEAAKRTAKENSESAGQPPGAASTTATQVGAGAGPADNASADNEITVIDAIAGLEKKKSHDEVAAYCDSLPSKINEDNRFVKAVAARMAAINGKGKK